MVSSHVLVKSQITNICHRSSLTWRLLSLSSFPGSSAASLLEESGECTSPEAHVPLYKDNGSVWEEFVGDVIGFSM